MKTFVMLDLETLALTPDAIVMSIGAVVYDAHRDIFASFEAFPDMNDQWKAGRRIDGDTIKWWFKQSDAARLSIANTTGSPVADVAIRFREWIDNLMLFENLSAEDVFYMANGNDFDLPILSTLFMPFIQVPWEGYPGFRQKICWRTMTVLFKHQIQYGSVKVAHNALDDARVQAEAHLALLQLHPEFT